MNIRPVETTVVELLDRTFTIERDYHEVEFFRALCRGICLEDFPMVGAKVKMIKIVKQGLGLGLKDAKEFVEQCKW